MKCRRQIKRVLHNFLGTYTSRYSDYDGYWLFGFLVGNAAGFDIDLLHAKDGALEAAPAAMAARLAADKLAEQIEKAGLPISSLREARLTITRSAAQMNGDVNGYACAGYDVTFLVKAVSDVGKTYERAISMFVAPHDRKREKRSTRGT